MAWHTRPELQPNFVNPQLRAYLAARARKQTGGLKLTNTIAFIGSNELYLELEHFAPVEQLSTTSQPVAADVLIVGGDWPRAGEPWREALLNTSESDAARLREFIAQHRARGIPAVLWLTGESEAVRAMLHLADAVDAVFAPAGLDCSYARILEPGVNVKQYNPLRGDIDAAEADAPFFRYLIDGAHELSGKPLSAALAPFLEFNSWIIDSAYHYQIPNMKFDAAWRRRFIGHVDTAVHAFLMQNSHGIFLPKELRDIRPVYYRKRMREAAACKALVFSDEAAEDGVVVLDEGDREFLSRLERDDVLRLGMAQRAWRNVLSNETIFERLEAIFAAVNVRPLYSETFRPSINVVMPTLRPELIPFALTMFGRQTYERLSLSIVANGVPVPGDIARLVSETPGVCLYSVPRDKTLGYCMNFGIDQQGADYWAKWDDDDVYGPHYFEDQMLQRKYADFEVAGKAAIFGYVEDLDTIYLRSLTARDGFSKHVGGGTIVAKNPCRYFAEDGRGGEDRAFLFLARERGDRILTGDPFNFLQVRRSDPASHTWTLGAHAQDLRGPRRSGLDLEGIML
jgi:hypothetical protein